MVTSSRKLPCLCSQLPMEPPGTYSRKLGTGVMFLSVPTKARDLHAQVCRSLLKPKVLNDVRVIQILQRLTLQLQSLHDSVLTRVISVARCLRQLHLLYCYHLSSSRVQSQVDTTVRPFSDEFSSHPLESSLKQKRNSEESGDWRHRTYGLKD